MIADAEAHAVLREVQAAWNEAMATWDADAVANLYDAQAQMFGSKPDLYLGPDGARRYYGSFVAERCVATFDNQAVVRPDPAIILGSGKVTFRVTVGGTEHVLDFRFSFVLRRTDAWRILMHHASPVAA